MIEATLEILPGLTKEKYSLALSIPAPAVLQVTGPMQIIFILSALLIRNLLLILDLCSGSVCAEIKNWHLYFGNNIFIFIVDAVKIMALFKFVKTTS